MRKDNKPTDEQLIELYQAASDFKKAEPWKWLYDADLICVENPKDKMIGYCSVMGKAGEHYALGVYLGDEGLSGFCDLMENADIIPYHQALHFQDCIMCSFEDRELLSKQDREEIKALGFSFRGRNAWPRFRQLKPGFYPWFINQDECVFLTYALRQTLFAAHKVIDGQLRMDIERGETILRHSKEKDGKLEWYSKEILLDFPTVIYNPVEINDDLLIQRIKKAEGMGNASLQVDICYLPSPVQEKRGARPYFPRIFILVEPKSGLVVDFHMYQSINDDADVALNRLIGFCLEKGVPREIQVRSAKMVAILDDFCQKTDIKLKMVKSLSSIDQVLEEMADRF
ncbi:MAG TPA: hypothetical protein DEB05_06465 [Firmicutes bacterium]|nr:hypothetical protein [Bacillota bacterium]